jgi:hypothetical protein
VVAAGGQTKTGSYLSIVELLFLKDFEENNAGWVTGIDLKG